MDLGQRSLCPALGHSANPEHDTNGPRRGTIRRQGPPVLRTGSPISVAPMGCLIRGLKIPPLPVRREGTFNPQAAIRDRILPKSNENEKSLPRALASVRPGRMNLPRAGRMGIVFARRSWGRCQAVTIAPWPLSRATCSCGILQAASVAPAKFAPVSTAPVRSANERSAPAKPAPPRRAPRRSA